MEKLNNNYHLIIKYLQKNLTASEAIEFRNLMETDKRFKKEADEMILTSVTIESIIELRKNELIYNKNKKRKLTIVFSIAASLFFLLTLSFVSFYNTLKEKNSNKITIAITAKYKSFDIKNIIVEKYRYYKNNRIFIESTNNIDVISFNELLSYSDISEIYTNRASYDSLNYYLKTKNYQKAIFLIENQQISTCEKNIILSQIYIIIVQNNIEKKLILQKVKELLKYSSNINNCYEEHRQASLLLLSYCMLLENNIKNCKLYLDTIILYQDHNNIYYQKAKKLKNKLNNYK